MHKQTCNECKCNLKHVTSTVSLTCFYAGKGVLKNQKSQIKCFYHPFLFKRLHLCSEPVGL